MDGQKPDTKADEIDLSQMFSNIGGFFRSGWMSFMRFLAVLRRVPLQNRVLFAVVIVASVIAGLLFTLSLRKTYYKSSMVFSTDYLNTRLAENVIKNLNSLTGDANRAALARTLSVSDEVASNIIYFSIEPFMAETDVIELEVFKEKLRNAKTAVNEKVIEDVISRMEVENRHSYEITVHTLKPDVIGNLQEGLVKYFRSIPYIQKRVEINKQNLIERQKRLAEDIAKLDSLKMVTYRSYKDIAKGSNNVILNDKAADPVLMYEQGLDIYQLYEEVTRDIYTQRDFEVVDGFTESNRPANASVPMMILFSILAGILVSYLAVALISFNNYLANLK